MICRRFLYAALLLPVQLIAGCSEGEPAEEVAQDRPAAVEASSAPADIADQKLVLAFGDSLYAGYGLEPRDSFPQGLEQALEASGIAARVHNAGVSGDTTAAGLQRLKFTLDGLPKKPDLALVGLGGNDMLRGLDPSATRANLDAILSELRRRDIPVLLTGMLAAPNLGADYGEQFNAIYPELARKHGAALDPFFLDGVVTDRSLMQADGLHPTATGVDMIVRRLTPVVADRLKA
jgi:acyl-CoA thioesterase-1